MTEAHKWRRLYTPPADLQGQIRDSPTANSFFFFFPISGTFWNALWPSPFINLFKGNEGKNYVKERTEDQHFSKHAIKKNFNHLIPTRISQTKLLKAGGRTLYNIPSRW